MVNFVPDLQNPDMNYITAYQGGTSLPGTSTLNDPTGTEAANMALVQAGADGSINVYSSRTTDLLVDIAGYFAAPGTGGLSLYTATPCRVLDTRGGSGIFGQVSEILTNNPCGVPSGLNAAYVLNATALPSGPLNYLDLWQTGQPMPTSSTTLNAQDGAITNNMAIVPSTVGSINAYASNQTQLILDFYGYFAPPLTSITDLTTCLGSGATACVLSPSGNPYSVNNSIVINRSNVTVGGNSPNSRPILVRGQQLSMPIMVFGKDVYDNPTTVDVSGVTVQNLVFCGGAYTDQYWPGSDPNSEHPEGDPCPRSASMTACESCERYPTPGCNVCDPSLFIVHTGAAQSWSSGAGTYANKSGPFSNMGPYRVTISSCQFEDEPGIQKHPIFIAPVATGQSVNDLLFTNNTISGGGGGGVQMGTFVPNGPNVLDYTQCDYWQTAPGRTLAFADDPAVTVPRNIRFYENRFYGNAVSGMGRYVQLDSNNPIQDITWPAGKGGGGLIEQETCGDSMSITGNTLVGIGDPLVSGMELYSRTLTIINNTVSGFGTEGIGLLGVNGANVGGFGNPTCPPNIGITCPNHLYNNNGTMATEPDIKLATRWPSGNCVAPAACEMLRDTTGVIVQNNDSSGRYGGNETYGIIFEDAGGNDGSTSNFNLASGAISGNTLTSAPSPLGSDQRINITDTSIPPPNELAMFLNGVFNSSLLSVVGSTAALISSSAGPQTIAVFPEGNQPLGMPLGQNDQATQNRRFFRFGGNHASGASALIGANANIQGFFDPSGPDSKGGPTSTTTACAFLFAPSGNLLYISNASGSINYSQSRQIPTADDNNPLDNTVCKIHTQYSSFNTYGNDAILILDVEFETSGNQNWYMYESVRDNQGNTNPQNIGDGAPWSLWGYWPTSR